MRPASVLVCEVATLQLLRRQHAVLAATCVAELPQTLDGCSTVTVGWLLIQPHSASSRATTAATRVGGGVLRPLLPISVC